MQFANKLENHVLMKVLEHIKCTVVAEDVHKTGWLLLFFQ